MPLFASLHLHHTSILLWRITETASEMLAHLPPHYAEALSRFRSSKRQCEWLAVRCLLHQQWADQLRIAYRPSGAPYLVRAVPSTAPLPSLSLSHAEGWAALAWSEQHASIGLDMEVQSEKAWRVRERFLHDNELPLAATPQHATSLWCAKEAAYKLVDQPTLHLGADIHLTPWPSPLTVCPVLTAHTPTPIACQLGTQLHAHVQPCEHPLLLQLLRIADLQLALALPSVSPIAP